MEVTKNITKKTGTMGFTLVELLVAISIIGILAALLIANMVGLRERGSDAKLKSDLRQMKTALRLLYNDTQSYPETSEFLSDYTDGTALQSSDGSIIYMKVLPEDVSYESAGGDDFLISVELANSGDEDICSSATRCEQACTPGTSTTYYECAD